MMFWSIQPAWSLGDHSWTLRAVKPLHINRARIPQGLVIGVEGILGASPCPDLSAAAAGGLETPGTCLLCLSIVHMVGPTLFKSTRLAVCLQHLPGMQAALGISTAAKLPV